jgi:hypothetical protein
MPIGRSQRRLVSEKKNPQMTAAHFFSAKSFYIMIYGLFGVFCICTSIRSVNRRLAGAFDSEAIRPSIVVVTAASIMLFGFVITGSHLLVATTVIGTIIFAVRHPAWRAPLALLTGTSAVALVLSLAWWRIEPSAIAPLSLAAFAVILCGLAIGFSDSWSCHPNRPVIQTIAFLVSGVLLLIDLGGYHPGESVLEGLAHHWGAFIGPALHIKAGLVPFYDIPIQYGLGPTLAIAAACHGTDCWTGMEVIVVVLNLANAFLILRMALTAAVPRGRLWQWAATIVVFAAVFLWPGFPSNGSSLIAFPSSSAIRFLPATLVACLLFFGRPAAAMVALVPAVLWSPESAAMSVAVFGLCEAARIGFVRAAFRSAGLLAGSYAGLVLLHRAAFGVWMDPAAFAEYVLHVPGPLPINPFSDAMLLAVVLGLGGWLIVRPSPDPVTARRDRTAVSLLFATTSYWFGRSHPNNICNLAPFLMLVAFRVLDRPRGDRSLLADATSFGLATSVAALAMSPWHSKPFDPRGTVDIHAVVADFSSVEPDIERIRGQIANPDGLGIADFGPHFLRHPSEKLVWTPMDPSSLWSSVPSERRQLYIQRSSARLRRSGWAIVYDDQRFLFDDLRAGYKVAEQHSFDGAPETPGGPPTHYVAVCFNPRTDIVASIVGPPCPLPTSRAP